MKKTWVIPDIHGCLATFKALIEHQIEPDKDDRLILLGDYIDRGPDSKGVIDYIIELEAQGYQINKLMGNHEDYCITAWEEDQDMKSFLGIRPKTKTQKEWEVYGGKQTLESFGVDRPREIPDKYINWMKDLEYFVEVDGYIMVHAGFNFEEEDPFADKFAMIWIREFQAKPESINGKTIIHGHVPINLEYIDMTINNDKMKVIGLDNGVYFSKRPGYGNLLALNLNTREYLVQSLMDEVEFKTGI